MATIVVNGLDHQADDSSLAMNRQLDSFLRRRRAAPRTQVHHSSILTPCEKEEEEGKGKGPYRCIGRMVGRTLEVGPLDSDFFPDAFQLNTKLSDTRLYLWA